MFCLEIQHVGNVGVLFGSHQECVIASLPVSVNDVLSELSSLCLSPLFLVAMALQTQDISPEDVHLENEPWYRFFSEMEFDKAVSGRSLKVTVYLNNACGNNIHV